MAVYPRGATKDAVIEIGPSERFPAEEIQAAMDVLLAGIHPYTGCRLKRLSYDEEKSCASFRDPSENRIC